MNLTYIPFSYYFRMNYNLKKKKEKSLSVTNISTYTYPFSNFYNNIYLISFLNDSIKLRLMEFKSEQKTRKLEILLETKSHEFIRETVRNDPSN